MDTLPRGHHPGGRGTTHLVLTGLVARLVIPARGDVGGHHGRRRTTKRPKPRLGLPGGRQEARLVQGKGPTPPASRPSPTGGLRPALTPGSSQTPTTPGC